MAVVMVPLYEVPQISPLCLCQEPFVASLDVDLVSVFSMGQSVTPNNIFFQITMFWVDRFYSHEIVYESALYLIRQCTVTVKDTLFLLYPKLHSVSIVYYEVSNGPQFVHSILCCFDVLEVIICGWPQHGGLREIQHGLVTVLAVVQFIVMFSHRLA